MGRASRVVWITGASSGIGAALAERWAAQGDEVILSARRKDALERVWSRLSEPSRALVLPLDLEVEAEIEAAAALALAWRGRVDVLVHCAGFSQRATAVATTMPTARRLIEVHYFALLALCRAVVPAMLARGAGRVVVVSSVAGYVATPQRSSYAAAKHAQRAWADALRAELYGTGVGVTVVCPGYVATGVSAHALRGDGSENGRVDAVDAGGMDVQAAAEQIAAAVDAGRPEVWVGGKETLAIWLSRWCPALVRWALPRASPK